MKRTIACIHASMHAACMHARTVTHARTSHARTHARTQEGEHAQRVVDPPYAAGDPARSASSAAGDSHGSTIVTQAQQPGPEPAPGVESRLTAYSVGHRVLPKRQVHWQ